MNDKEQLITINNLLTKANELMGKSFDAEKAQALDNLGKAQLNVLDAFYQLAEFRAKNK